MTGFFKTWSDEFKGLLNSGAVHGLGHLSERTSVIVKILWLLVIGFSILMVIISVKAAVDDWRNNPTETIIETFDHPVSEIQFPTVTVCPQGDIDRWGYIRAIFNSVKFKCKGQEDCEDTKNLRSDYQHFLDLFANYIWNTINDNLDLIHIEPVFFSETYAKVMHYLTMTQNETSNVTLEEANSKLEMMAKALILSEITQDDINRELEQDLSMNVTTAQESSVLNSTADDHAKILSYFMLSGDPGHFGTLLSNFVPLVIGGTFDEVNFPESPLAYELTHEEIVLHDKFAEILNMMVGNEVNISLYDLPAIFVPRNSHYMSQKWNTWYSYTMKSHPDFLKGYLDQPYFAPLLSANRKEVMEIIKESVPQSSRSQEDLKYLFSEKSPFKEIYTMESFLDKTLNSFTPASYCTDNYVQLTPVLTEQGPCVAFNSYSLADTFKPSPYVHDYMELFPMINRSQDVQNSGGSGKSYALNMVLDGRQSKRDGKYGANFLINLNQMFDFFDTSNGGYEVHIGYKTHILVTPVQHVSTDDFRDLPLETRNCRYIDENPMEDSIFSFYTQKSCLFECGLRIGREMFEGCVPWYLPHNVSSVPMCDGRQEFWFDFMRYHPSISKNCTQTCLPNCDEIRFEHSINSQVKLDPDAECKTLEMSKFMSVNMQAILKMLNHDGEYFLWNIQQLRSGERVFLRQADFSFASHLTDETIKKVCKESVLRDFAVVQIELKTARIQRIQKKLRVTLSDQVGILGGNFGLFTGLSIIGMIEIAYWIIRIFLTFIRTLLKMLMNGGKGRRRNNKDSDENKEKYAGTKFARAKNQ